MTRPALLNFKSLCAWQRLRLNEFTTGTVRERRTVLRKMLLTKCAALNRNNSFKVWLGTEVHDDRQREGIAGAGC